MSKSTQKPGTGTKIRRERVNADAAIGMCLVCSHRITLCGKPFTADIECSKCNTINQFRDSQQPVTTGGNVAHG
jgi:hypothetical protein